MFAILKDIKMSAVIDRTNNFVSCERPSYPCALCKEDGSDSYVYHSKNGGDKHCYHQECVRKCFENLKKTHIRCPVCQDKTVNKDSLNTRTQLISSGMLEVSAASAAITCGFIGLKVAGDAIREEVIGELGIIGVTGLLTAVITAGFLWSKS